MRIIELLEGKKFDDLNFVKNEGDKTEVNFDLCEDLVFYMNNDDDVYRRYVYPSVSKCIEDLEANKETHPSIFKKAVESCYKAYLKHYPIRHLPGEIDQKVCEETCKKMYEEVCEHHDEGKYKD